jgi:hypothetical protein
LDAVACPLLAATVAEPTGPAASLKVTVPVGLSTPGGSGRFCATTVAARLSGVQANKEVGGGVRVVVVAAGPTTTVTWAVMVVVPQIQVEVAVIVWVPAARFGIETFAEVPLPIVAVGIVAPSESVNETVTCAPGLMDAGMIDNVGVRVTV